MNNTDRLCLGCMNDNGGERVCPICGYDRDTEPSAEYLAPGTWIKDQYLLGRVLETGGEGVTYIGWDNLRNNVVNIKEYFPVGLCHREPNMSVAIDNGKEYEYNNGIMEFIEISRKCGNLEALPSVMPTVETLETNGTAYSIIKISAGITLREFLLRNGGALQWEQAKPLFLPLISSLEEMHKVGILHLGISPDTIIVGRDGKLHLSPATIPEVRREDSEFLTQLYSGFAALEQYKNGVPSASSDVYAVAATLFRVLIGSAPLSADEREVHDNMSIPSKVAETIPQFVLIALANALQLKEENRTKSMIELKEALSVAGAASKITVSEAEEDSEDEEEAEEDVTDNRRLALIAAGITAGVILIIAILLVFTVFRSRIFGEKRNKTPVDAPSVVSYGDTDSTSSEAPKERLYEVPAFKDQKYTDVVNNVDYAGVYTFSVKGAEFSDTVPAGSIVSQSVEAGASVKKDTEIGLVISAGPANIKVPSLAGKTQQEAYVTLLELGVGKDCIEFIEKYDDTKTPEVVISTEPAAGTTVSRYDKIIVFKNSYVDTSSYEHETSEDSKLKPNSTEQ